MSEGFDTVVIGAGAAGLAAASALLDNTDDRIAVLEGRDRIGGRILTLEPAGESGVIELGAEFVHGESPATLSQLRKSGCEVMDAPQTRWMLQSGELKRADDPMERMKRRLQRIGVPARDLAFGEFLQRHRRALGASASTLARLLVTGFDAADLDRVSTRDILDEWGGQSAADAPTFRPVGGYGLLVASLAAALRVDRCDLRLRHRVTDLRWRRGRVEIAVSCDGGSSVFIAKRAVVTVPLGVLQGLSHATIRFDPPLPRKSRALSHLAMGPVLKLVLRFREPFWESVADRRYRSAVFFHAPGAPFPTLWTSLPLRNSRLVAWAAGPDAARLSGKGADVLVDAAVQSLRAVFGSRRRYRSMLQSFHWHDWQIDPFSAGAYSYVCVNGSRARTELARPVADTLYFAGEACDAEESAAVGGALQSGIDAALRIGRGAR